MNEESEVRTNEEYVKFEWSRNRIFDREICEIIFEKIKENPIVKIVKISRKRKTKTKPFPLNTIEMTKLISRKLRMGSHRAMDVAESLYNKGFLSYPRTETNKFSKTLNLKEICGELKHNSVWGSYASKIYDGDAY